LRFLVGEIDVDLVESVLAREGAGQVRYSARSGRFSVR